MKTDFKSVDEYIASQPEGVQSVLNRVRTTIREAVPEAEETISYKIPAYKLHGNRVLFFAGWKQHYSLYPATRRVVEAFKDDLAPYEVSKGTIRFPLSEPVPVKLIGRIAKFRAKEVSEGRDGKKESDLTQSSQRTQSSQKNEFSKVARETERGGLMTSRPFLLDTAESLVTAVVIAVVVSEVKQIEQISDCGAVLGYIGVIPIALPIREVIAATGRQWLQISIALDEFQDRDVVCIGVADVAAAGERRNGDERNARAVAEKVQRLDVAGVIEAPALVQSDEQNGGRKQFLVGGEMIHDFLSHGLEKVEL